jgi:hypothetical protein
MRSVQRRLRVLERLPQFQPPPSPLEQIGTRVLKQMSFEDFDLIMVVLRKQDRGECQTLLPSESAAVESYNAGLDTEARRMGFKSYADAQRRAGPKRILRGAL